MGRPSTQIGILTSDVQLDSHNLIVEAKKVLVRAWIGSMRNGVVAFC